MAKGGNMRKGGQKTRTGQRRKAYDGITLACRGQSGDITGAANAFSGSILVDCASGGAVLGPLGNNIVGNFMEYRFTEALVEFLPKVSPGSTAGGGRIYMAYLDNPEQIVNWMADTVANNLAAIKGFRNCITFNVWQRKTYRVPLTHRRPWFDVNKTSTNAVDVLDRSTQGVIVFAGDTIGATDVVGSLVIKSVISLRGGQGTITT